MDSNPPRKIWKGIVIALLVLALLASWVWLFLRPTQPARDIVFGDLGRREIASNSVAGGPGGTATGTPGMSVPGGSQPTNAPSREELVQDQGAGRMTPAPSGTQAGQGMSSNEANSAQSGNAPENSNSPVTQTSPPTNPASAVPPSTRAARQGIHKRAAFEDNYPPPPETTNKVSTAALLTAAKEAGREPDNPTPAQTADLLENNETSSRIFDARTGSNVVFIVANSLSMMTNGKSATARQAVAQALESMNASQTFYVLLFHTGGYEGMPALGPVSATPENVRAMTNWLFNVGFRTGADPTKAVQRALGLAPVPDTVWLLSDSDLPDAAVNAIRDANASVNAHFNTIGFFSREGELGLRRVADENRGSYRFIPPSNPSVP